MTRRAAALFFALVILAQADTVVLRNGTTVKGVWMGADSDKINLLVGGQVKPFARADVSTVTFGDEPATASAPETPKQAEPDETNVVYWQDEAGKLLPLEERGGKPAGLLRGPEEEWKIKGAKSTVRLKSGQKMVFVMKLEKPKENEAKRLLFLELESDTKKDSRYAPLYGHFPFDVTKMGDVVYLTPKKNFSPGEYAFERGLEFFCFGVDDATGNSTH